MAIRELSEIQEDKLQVIELTGIEAHTAYQRMSRIMKSTDIPDVAYIAGFRYNSVSENGEVYHIVDSTVVFRFDYNARNPDKITKMQISIASPNPDYREESLSKLEQIMGMRLRKGERPAVITAQN